MIITTAIIKGGTGKSTTAAALAQAARQDGKKVLCIDLDPQANLTYFLGAEHATSGSYDVIKAAGGKSDSDARAGITGTEQGIDCMAADSRLSQLTTKHGSALRLEKALERIKAEYDLIIIDTPPAIGELAYNAIQAADRYIVPLEADNNSVSGLSQIVSIAEQIRQTSNKKLSLVGAFITRHSAQSKINRFLRDNIERQVTAAGIPYLGEIRQGVAIKEAQTLQRNLYEYAPKSKPAMDYLRLYESIKACLDDSSVDSNE